MNAKSSLKKQSTSIVSAVASFFIGLSALPALMAIAIWRNALAGFLTSGFTYLSRYYDWVTVFPVLLSPFVLLISIVALLLERKRKQMAHFAPVPFGVGFALSVIGAAILFFFAMIAFMASEYIVRDLNVLGKLVVSFTELAWHSDAVLNFVWHLQ